MDLVNIRRSRDAESIPGLSRVMTHAGGPKSVWLQITSKCNQTCDYCYMSATKESHDHLSLEQIEHVFTVSKRMGVETMLISGGEPTIVKALPQILKSSCLDHGFKTYLVTNGSGVTPSLVELLRELDIFVQVSMDSVDDEAYAAVRGLPILPRIKQNVVRMLESDVGVALSVPITNVVDTSVVGVLKWAIEVGVQNVHVATSYGQRTGVTENLTKQEAASVLRELYTFQKENYELISIDLIENMVISMVGAGEACATYCTPMSGKTLEIDAKGNAYYCGAILTIPEMALGNVFDPNFETSYRTRGAASAHLALTPDKLTVCSTCEYRQICKGGCRSQALFYTGDLFGPVSHCADLKALFAEMVTDYKTGRLDDLIDFLKMVHGESLTSHTKCF